MATMTLDFIREAAEKKYGSLDIELDANTTVKLLNPLRLTHAKRTELMAVQKELSAEAEEVDGVKVEKPDEDQGLVFDQIFRLICENEIAAEKLIASLGGDLALKAVIFDNYGEATEAGEASASQD